MVITQAKMNVKAIELLDALHKANQKYDKINTFLQKEINSDFRTPYIALDEHIEGKVVEFLDWVLGYDIASYFLYECQHMKNGGSIEDGGKKWRIKTIDDVVKYVADMMEQDQTRDSI